MQALTERIKLLLCENVAPELDVRDIGDDDGLIRDLSLDSLQLLSLISELEKAFDFVLEDEDLDIQSFENVTSVAQFVQKKLEC